MENGRLYWVKAPRKRDTKELMYDSHDLGLWHIGKFTGKPQQDIALAAFKRGMELGMQVARCRMQDVINDYKLYKTPTIEDDTKC